MKSLESLPSEVALRRLVLARIAAGLVVLIAIVVAPPVSDSVVTFNFSALELADLQDGDDGLQAENGVEVLETTAEPVEPLSMSY
jgi:hypothetical protein